MQAYDIKGHYESECSFLSIVYIKSSLKKIISIVINSLVYSPDLLVNTKNYTGQLVPNCHR